jgi:hypothetical protein
VRFETSIYGKIVRFTASLSITHLGINPFCGMAKASKSIVATNALILLREFCGMSANLRNFVDN